MASKPHGHQRVPRVCLKVGRCDSYTVYTCEVGLIFRIPRVERINRGGVSLETSLLGMLEPIFFSTSTRYLRNHKTRTLAATMGDSFAQRSW